MKNSKKATVKDQKTSFFVLKFILFFVIIYYMKSNILLVGLDYDFIKNVANELANKFDMFFLDVNDLIEYNLIDTKNVKVTCGVEYFEKVEKKIALSVAEYENTVINFPYSLFLNANFANILSQRALTIFIKMDKETLVKENFRKGENKLSIEILTCDELNKLLEEKVDLTVGNSTLNTKICIDDIVEKLKNIDLDGNN